MKKPQSQDFKDWHAKSRIKHLVYHATRFSFEAFDTSKGDLGSHFGTLEQANNVAANRYGNCAGIHIIPVWINLVNPIRLNDVGSFHADGIALQLEKKGLLPKGEGKRIEKEVDASWRLRQHYDPILIGLIKKAGYDGVVYANTADHEGAGDSYIVFDSEQVVFAVSNQFNSVKNNKRPVFGH